MITEYDGMKLDLSTAQGLLEDCISDVDSWEIYALIEAGEYEAALRRLRELAQNSGLVEASEFVAEIERRARLIP